NLSIIGIFYCLIIIFYLRSFLILSKITNAFYLSILHIHSDLLLLLSFPTRRSSDLFDAATARGCIRLPSGIFTVPGLHKQESKSIAANFSSLWQQSLSCHPQLHLLLSEQLLLILNQPFPAGRLSAYSGFFVSATYQYFQYA